MVKKYMSIIDATNVVTKGVFIPKLDITQLKQQDNSYLHMTIFRKLNLNRLLD